VVDGGEGGGGVARGAEGVSLAAELHVGAGEVAGGLGGDQGDFPGHHGRGDEARRTQPLLGPRGGGGGGLV